MRYAECGRFAYAARRVHHLLHLRRAHAIARGLDHLVAPADEIEKALFVSAHCVARPHGYLRHDDAGWLPGHRLEALRGLFRIVPVAQRHERAAMHELARLVRIAWRAV